jgi:hypothetical protein
MVEPSQRKVSLISAAGRNGTGEKTKAKPLMVVIEARGKANMDALLREAAGMFGHETVRSGEDYLWRFDDVAVVYSVELEDQASLLYQYIGFLRNR